MNQQTFEEKKSENIWAAENLDFDNLDFKPLTKGLGFNDEKLEAKNKVIPKIAKKPLDKREVKPLATATSLTKTSRPATNTLVSRKREVFNEDVLQAFYGKSVEEIVPSEKVEKEQTKLIAGKASAKLGAWIIDTSVIVGLSVLTTLLLSVIAEQRYDFIQNTDFWLGSLPYMISFFAVYYVAYFTLLDFTSTLGKNAFQLKLVREDESQVDIMDTFTRSLISLLSFLALGLPLLFDFQGKLSETKIVQGSN